MKGAASKVGDLAVAHEEIRLLADALAAPDQSPASMIRIENMLVLVSKELDSLRERVG